MANISCDTREFTGSPISGRSGGMPISAFCLTSQTRAFIKCDKLPTRRPSLRSLKYFVLISSGPLSSTYPKPMARRSLDSNPGSKNACHTSPTDATRCASASKRDRWAGFNKDGEII